MNSIASKIRRANYSESLEEWLCKMISEQHPHSILITLQPNIGWGPGNGERVWRKFRELLYRLDSLFQNIRRPELLPKDCRFEGVAIMEKVEFSPHIHFILYGKNKFDCLLKYLFLLEHLNNTWKLAYQRVDYKALRMRNDQAGRPTKPESFSLWQEKFPGGTADVRLIHDIPWVVGYVTKEIREVRMWERENAGNRKIENSDNLRLIEYTDPDPKSKARIYTYDPENPKRIILNLDKPIWRNSYHRIR